MLTPDNSITTTKALTLYQSTLNGNNYSPESLRAYMSDLNKFLEYLKTRRVDYDVPYRIQRIDIVEYINTLASKKLSSETRKRKLASIRSLTVRGGKGRKDRSIPLERQAIDALKEYIKERVAIDEYNQVFIARNGTSMDPRTVRYMIHKYYKEAGIKKRASVHTLRHTFATHKVHNGMKLPSLKEVLGHRNMQTTYKYIHLDRTNLRQEMEDTAL